MKQISISQLVKQTGLTSATIRYYEQKGLIVAIGRNGLQRVFNQSVLKQLKLICLGKKAGFSLDDIASMLSNQDQPIDKSKLELKAVEIDQMIMQLDVLRTTLRHVANCPYDNPLDCDNFQKILTQTGFK